MYVLHCVNFLASYQNASIIPTEIFSCHKAPIRPRIWEGEISAMYIGTSMEQAPTPPMQTKIVNSKIGYTAALVITSTSKSTK